MSEEGESRATEAQKRWMDELSAADKRLEKYRKYGDGIVERYVDFRDSAADTRAREADKFRLNLFHTHVSTLLSMLYGRIPVTEVSRKFHDANDDKARVAALILKRLLDGCMEEPGYGFGDILRACLEDRLLPGHGVARVRYDAQFEDVTNPEYEEYQAQKSQYDELPEEDKLVPFEGEEPEETIQQLVTEDVFADYVHWRDFRWGYGRLWKDIPWVAIDHYMGREEVEERWSKEVANQLTFKRQPIVSGEYNGELSKLERNAKEEALVVEILDRENREIIFVSPEAYDILVTESDPWGLDGFFPMPKPMIANSTTTIYRPTADFRIAEDLYNEIDLLQTRIGVITQAIKVVGVYDQSSGEIQRMFTEGVENDLIPVSNWALFAEKGGIKGVIDWLPIEEIVGVLKTLQETLRSTIELLYEVTGLSDILRGAQPAPRESAASSMQRARFASVRVQRLQDEFAEFASEIMAVKAKMIARFWDRETIYQRANCEALMEAPELVEAAVNLISEEEDWRWKITIKPESIALIDYAQMQQDRMEFLAAAGAFVNSMSSLLQVAPQGAPLLLQMLKWGMAGFKGADEIEGVMDKAIEQAVQELNKPGQGDNQSQAKINEETVKHQAKMKEQQQKFEHEMQTLLTEHKLKIDEISAESNADAIKEKLQAHYGILEAQAKEAIQRRAAELKESVNG